jgi:hypothetical protein
LQTSTWRKPTRSLAGGLAFLRERAWARWLVSFGILFSLGALWAVANPPMAAPDEPAHVVHAAAVARGEFFGKPLTRGQRALFPARAGFGPNFGASVRLYTSVRVPEIYDRVNWGCMWHHPEQTAACLDFSGSQRDVPVVTHADTYSPPYYLWVGLPARLASAGPRAMYVMRLAAVALAAALLASAIVSLGRIGDSPLVMLGVLVAVTPTVLFLAAGVNPSGLEIAAGLALWISGAVLAIESRSVERGRVDRRLVARVGIAGAVLVLSRQLGPMWAALILVVLAGWAGRHGLRTLVASRAAWVWGAVVGVSALAQVAWLEWVDGLDPHKYIGAPSHETGVELVERGIGQSSMLFRQMIGDFGWNEVPAPAFTLYMWIAALGGLAALAFVFGRRRDTVVLAVVGVLSAALPIALIVYQSGYAPWLGRYTMPFAVGAPVVAGLALRGRGLGGRRVAVLLAVAGLAVGHVLAFGQSLRRWTVLADGPVQFWKDAQWAPPLSPLPLMVAFIVAVVAWCAWLMVPAPARTSEPLADADVVQPDLAEARAAT